MQVNAVLWGLIGFAAGFAVAYLFFLKKKSKLEAELSQLKSRAEGSEALKDAASLLVEMAKTDLEKRQQSIEKTLSPISDLLKKLEEELKEIEKRREVAYSSLRQEIEALSESSEKLRQSAEKLAQALRTPSFRGRWGELALKNIAELAGLSEHCDFELQSAVETEEGVLRPDMLIRLPGERFIAVDAKAPVENFLKALEAEDDEKRKKFLELFAKNVRDHIKRLSEKLYWRGLKGSPDFVVMFLPSEALLSAALEAEKNLIEEALKKGVVIATPMTFMALLKVVALFWREETVNKSARELLSLAREVSERINKFLGHFSKVGKSLSQAVKAYNEAVGSWQNRVEPGLRRFSEISGAQLKELSGLEKAVRELPLEEEDGEAGKKP